MTNQMTLSETIHFLIESFNDDTFHSLDFVRSIDNESILEFNSSIENWFEAISILDRYAANLKAIHLL